MLKKLGWHNIVDMNRGIEAIVATRPPNNEELCEKINELVDFINKLYEINCIQNNQIARLEQEVRELGGFKPIGDK